MYGTSAAPLPGVPAASMELTLTGPDDGVGGELSVRLPGAAGSLPGFEGVPADTLAVLELAHAGWVPVEGDTLPAAFVSFLEPGAYCCAHTLVARRGDGGRWSWTMHSWGSYRNLPALDDIDGDGALEWVALDEVFAAPWPHVLGAFGPLAIWQLTARGFEPVTWRFPAEVDRHRRELAAAPDDSDLALASWIAETRLLGRPVAETRVHARVVGIEARWQYRRSAAAWLRAVGRLTERYVTTHGRPRARRDVASVQVE